MYVCGAIFSPIAILARNTPSVCARGNFCKNVCESRLNTYANIILEVCRFNSALSQLSLSRTTIHLTCVL